MLGGDERQGSVKSRSIVSKYEIKANLAQRVDAKVGTTSMLQNAFRDGGIAGGYRQCRDPRDGAGRLKR